MAKKTRFPKAQLKLIPTEVREAMNSMGEAELDEVIVESTAVIAENKRLLKTDPAVLAATEALADAKADFADAIKAHGARIAYALYAKGLIDDPEGD